MLRKYVLVGLFLVPFVALSNAYAFVTFGISWPNNAAGYWVNPRNDSGVSDAAVLESMNGAADAWGTVGAGFNYCYQGTTTRSVVALNGFNDIFFRNQEQGGVIAVTQFWRSGPDYVEFDIVFFEGRFQFFGINDGCAGGFYIWYIAMHELGHGLGLGHPPDPTAIMYATASRCDGRTALELDDIAGVQFLYGIGDVPGCN